MFINFFSQLLCKAKVETILSEKGPFQIATKAKASQLVLKQGYYRRHHITSGQLSVHEGHIQVLIS